MKLRRSNRSIALLLVLCLCFTMLPATAVALEAEGPSTLEPETLLEGVIYNNVGWNLSYGLGEVGGHDYLYLPCQHILYVFDLDTWELVDTQGMENGTSIGAFVDSKGIVWVYGAKKNLFRYDPFTKEGEVIQVPIMAELEVSKLYHPMELDDKLYFGTYGSGGAYIVEYDPATGVFTNISGLLVPGGKYCSSMIYRDGYIYATVTSANNGTLPQCVVKFDMTTREVVDRFDIPAPRDSHYYVDSQIVGDVLLLSSLWQSTIEAIDISGDKMTYATLNNVPDTGIVGAISEVVDGKAYFFTRNYAIEDVYYSDFYCYDSATKSFTKLNSYDPIDTQIRCLQNTMVTIHNDALGLNGKYIFTTYIGGTVILFGLDGTYYELTGLLDTLKTANRLTSLTRGPDGTNSLYMGSYMNNTAAKYDIATGQVTMTATNSSQLDQNFFYDGKWYVTTYGACALSEVKANGSVNKLFSLNEGANKNYFSQERMHNFTAGDNKVFTSTVPHKGEYGGFIAWYDYEKKATYVAVEKDLVLYAKDGAQETWYNAKTDEPYSFTRDFDGLVKDQTVKTLVYQDGLIYACTTTLGGSATAQKNGASAVLLVYDPVKMELVATHDIRDSVDGFDFDLGGFGGVAADPDVPGKFWGLFASTLFTFTFDKEAKTFNVTEALTIGEKVNHPGTNPASWSPWKHYFSDGYLFYFAGGATEDDGWIMMVSTDDPSYYAKLPCNTRSFFVLGEDNNVYSARETSLYKWNTADLVAQVKAGKGAADQEAAAAVQAKIDAIGTVTLESEEAIKEARAAYDAMSDTRKALVNAEALTAAEAKLAELKATAPAPVSPVLYVVIAVAAAAVIAAVVIVLIRKKKS